MDALIAAVAQANPNTQVLSESNWGASESERVRIHVSRRELPYWFTALQRWVLPEGERTIYVAASSRDIRLQRRVWVGGEHIRF